MTKKGESKYPLDDIIKDYKQGMGYRGLETKYGINRAEAWKLMHRLGIARTISQGKLFKYDGWLYLVKGKNKGRQVSIRSELLEQLGFCRDDILQGKWSVIDKKLVLLVRKMPENTKHL